MILAISTFRVANGMEGEVKKAFFNRPHLVDCHKIDEKNVFVNQIFLD